MADCAVLPKVFLGNTIRRGLRYSLFMHVFSRESLDKANKQYYNHSNLILPKAMRERVRRVRFQRVCVCCEQAARPPGNLSLRSRSAESESK